MKRLTKKEKQRVLKAMALVDGPMEWDCHWKFCCNALNPYSYSSRKKSKLAEQFKEFFGYPEDDPNAFGSGWFGDCEVAKNQDARATALALFLAAEGIV